MGTMTLPAEDWIGCSANQLRDLDDPAAAGYADVLDQIAGAAETRHSVRVGRAHLALRERGLMLLLPRTEEMGLFAKGDPDPYIITDGGRACVCRDLAAVELFVLGGEL